MKFEKTFHFELENMSYVTIILPVCHAKLLFGQLHAYDVCIIALLKLCFTFEAGEKIDMGGSFLDIFSPGVITEVIQVRKYVANEKSFGEPSKIISTNNISFYNDFLDTFSLL